MQAKDCRRRNGHCRSNKMPGSAPTFVPLERHEIHNLALIYATLIDLGNVSAEAHKRPNRMQVDLLYLPACFVCALLGSGYADRNGELRTSCCTQTLEKGVWEQGARKLESRQMDLQAGKRGALFINYLGMQGCHTYICRGGLHVRKRSMELLVVGELRGSGPPFADKAAGPPGRSPYWTRQDVSLLFGRRLAQNLHQDSQ